MAVFKPKVQRGINTDLEVLAGDQYRDTRTLGQQIATYLFGLRGAKFGFLMLGALAFLQPGMADLISLLGLFYFCVVFSKDKRNPVCLPLKLPMTSGIVDPNQIDLKTRRPDKAKGIKYIGNDRETGEQLWQAKEDATTHTLILGSTGAGKTVALISLCVNFLSWASGFIYTDGKGDTKLWDDIYPIVRRFGRDDDLRILNYMTGNVKGGGQSNTTNPFTKGTADALKEMMTSLMDSAGGDNAMWKGRAISLNTALMMAMTEKRDAGEILLDVDTIRDHLPLVQIYRLFAEGERTGNLSSNTLKALRGYLDGVPGFSWDKAQKGEPQSDQTNNQHGFLMMQFTKLLSTFADVYGHIFRTQVGDIDMEDVVLNRRILITLIPALEKSADEVSSLGKINVAGLKDMMGKSIGNALTGDREEIILNKPTNADNAYGIVWDEAGYYTVEGMAVILAQARSLNFDITVGSQDVNSMKRLGGIIEKEVQAIIANCNTKIGLKNEDPEATYDLFARSGGRALVQESSGKEYRSSSDSYVDSHNVGVHERARIDYLDMKSQEAGHGHLLFSDKIIRCETPFLFASPAKYLRAHVLVKVRPPIGTAVATNSEAERELTVIKARLEGKQPLGIPAPSQNMHFGRLAEFMARAPQKYRIERAGAAFYGWQHAVNQQSIAGGEAIGGIDVSDEETALPFSPVPRAANVEDAAPDSGDAATAATDADGPSADEMAALVQQTVTGSGTPVGSPVGTTDYDPTTDTIKVQDAVPAGPAETGTEAASAANSPDAPGQAPGDSPLGTDDLSDLMALVDQGIARGENLADHPVIQQSGSVDAAGPDGQHQPPTPAPAAVDATELSGDTLAQIAKDFLGQIDSALGTPPHQATDNADRLAGAIHATRDQYPAPPQPAMLTEDVVMELASYLIPGEAISVKGEDQKKS